MTGAEWFLLSLVFGALMNRQANKPSDATKPGTPIRYDAPNGPDVDPRLADKDLIYSGGSPGGGGSDVVTPGGRALIGSQARNFYGDATNATPISNRAGDWLGRVITGGGLLGVLLNRSNRDQKGDGPGNGPTMTQDEAAQRSRNFMLALSALANNEAGNGNPGV